MVSEQSTSCKKNKRLSLARLFLLSTPLLLLAPSPTHATVVTALKFVVGGVSLTADLATATSTLANIFGTGDIGTQADDHPLYSIGNSSPSLTIAATPTSFNLLLKQSNDVGEPEDDLPGVLSGTVKVPIASGMVEAWKFKITLEADINTFSFSELDAEGSVQHVFRPHPELGEMDGSALDYNMSVTQEQTSSRHTIKDNDEDRQKHRNGPHYDSLSASLEAVWNTSDVWDSIEVRLDASHRLPEPSMLSIFVSGLITLLILQRPRHHRAR